MTTNAQHTPLLAAYNLRLDAKAFRENTVYDSEGDPIRLIANAERMEAGADAIEALLEALQAIAEATSAEDDAGENYRWDDREGALDFAYATAFAAIGEPK